MRARRSPPTGSRRSCSCPTGSPPRAPPPSPSSTRRAATSSRRRPAPASAESRHGSRPAVPVSSTRSSTPPCAAPWPRRWRGCSKAPAAAPAAPAPAGEGPGIRGAGPAGLAAGLARRLGRESMGRDRGANPPRLLGPLLVVAGSAHPVTRAQVVRLRASGIDARWGLWPDDADGVEDPARRARTAQRLAVAAQARVDAARPGTPLLAGGETAVSVGRTLEATGFRLDREGEAGL